MIGGCIWRIEKDEEQHIIYAINYNHKRERHLDGFNLDTIISSSSHIPRPDLFITDCGVKAQLEIPDHKTKIKPSTQNQGLSATINRKYRNEVFRGDLAYEINL